MKTVTIYTDGACSGNPGPGGWGTILLYKGVEKELSGGEAQTTNNRKELCGVIAGLKALKERCLAGLLTIPGMERVGAGEAPHILCMALPGYPSANIVTELGEQGVCISAGSACHRGKASHVFTAMGLPKRTAAGTFRVSFGPESTEEDVDALCAALREHQARRFPML